MTNSSESDVTHQENVYPAGFLQLFTSADVESSPEALSIYLHTCMLNVGFIPIDVEEQYVYRCMPKTWKAKGAWKFQYCHRTCHDYVCWMTCVPLYSYLAVHGVVEGFPCDNVYIKLKVSSYVNDESSISNVESLFINCQKLEKKFKDEFCFSLLASLQESAGCEPSFGLGVTVDEIKLYILKLLPVQSVVALSRVNKDFNRVVNSNLLWKYLLQRDFGLVDCSIEDNCKEVYRREYLKKKQKPRRYFHVYDPLFYPPYLPVNPTSYIDVRRDLDPALQQAFPHLRDRFRPNWIFPPYDFPGRFM